MGNPLAVGPHHRVIVAGGGRRAEAVLDWMIDARIRALNVAGNRRSIGDAWSAYHGHREGFEPRCERFLAGVFARALGRDG